MAKPDWEYRHEAIGAQGVYRALLAWAVEHSASNVSEPKSDRRRWIEKGHGDMLVRAAMVAYGDDEDAANGRVGDDWADSMASRV